MCQFKLNKFFYLQFMTFLSTSLPILNFNPWFVWAENQKIFSLFSSKSSIDKTVLNWKQKGIIWIDCLRTVAILKYCHALLTFWTGLNEVFVERENVKYRVFLKVEFRQKRRTAAVFERELNFWKESGENQLVGKGTTKDWCHKRRI